MTPPTYSQEEEATKPPSAAPPSHEKEEDFERSLWEHYKRNATRPKHQFDKQVSREEERLENQVCCFSGDRRCLGITAVIFKLTPKTMSGPAGSSREYGARNGARRGPRTVTC